LKELEGMAGWDRSLAKTSGVFGQNHAQLHQDGWCCGTAQRYVEFPFCLCNGAINNEYWGGFLTDEFICAENSIETFTIRNHL
jgi:hypothetical protein